MKVLQVLPTLSAGGAEGFVANLGVSLAGLGVEVRFLLLAGARGQRGQVLLNRLQAASVEVIGAEEHNVRSPMNLVRLTSLIRSWRPDVVQANLYSAEVACAIAKVLTIGGDARYVHRLTATDICYYRSPAIVRIINRFYCQTIACSPAVARAYRDFMGASHHSQIVTIPNGGLLQQTITTTDQKRQARITLELKANAFVVAHIGGMFGGDRAGVSWAGGQKAQDVLLRAFAKAFGGDSNRILVLLGEGPLRQEAENLATSLGIAKQVRFLGQQPEPWPALKAADMFCFPSRYEGLPNVLPEAASCGLPVLASDIPEIRSLWPGQAWSLKPVDDVQAFAAGLQDMAEHIEAYKNLAAEVAPGFREQFSMATCAKR